MTAFKVGLMALATMAAVVYMSFRITSNQSGFGDYLTYKTIVKDASGIFPKTPIKVAGINAGRIKDIELVGNNALITFEVLRKIKITKDSKLRIRTVGFLGDKYLEIEVGDSDKRLQEGGSIVAIEGEGVEQLVKDASEVLKDVKSMVKSVKDSMAPEGREPPVKKILANVEDITANAKGFMSRLESLMGENDERINSIMSNLDKTAANLSFETDGKMDKSSVAQLKKVLGNAEDLSRDMKKVMADIKRGKGTMGKLLVEEEIADEVRNTLSSVKKIVGRVDKIRTELEVFTGVNTDYGAESAASFRIYPSPERFYQLGVTTSEFGPETETITETTVNGGSLRREIERQKVKDEWRFDVQLGRKIHNWTIRGGLIESTGGFGVDYDLQGWNQRFSLEAFDYREEIGVNLRARTDLQLWNVVYGRLAAEDMLEDSRSLTISAGLRFSDEDLKSLIGFFL